MIFSACSNGNTVKVTGVDIEGSGTTVTIGIGDTQQLIAVVSPSNASNKKVTWDSENPDVANVAQDGTVTGIAAGTTTITVTTKSGNHTAAITVRVSAGIPVNSITLDEQNVVMLVGGDPVTLTATIAPATATDKTLAWTSSDTSVATVSDGVITAVSAGTATITATSVNDRTATCDVTVYAPGTSLKVTFDKNHNDASGFTEANPTEMEVTVPALTLETLPDAPTRDLHRFEGWYLNENGTGAEFTEESGIPDANTTVYAKWTYVGGTPYVEDNKLIHPNPIFTGPGTTNPDRSITWTVGNVIYMFPNDTEEYKIFDYDKFTVYYTSTAVGEDVMLANLENDEYHKIDEDGNDIGKNVTFVTDPEGGTHIFDIRGTNGERGLQYTKWREGAAANILITKVVFEKLTRVPISFDLSCEEVPDYTPDVFDDITGIIGLPIMPKINQAFLSLPTPSTVPEGRRFAGWLLGGTTPVTANRVLTEELVGGATSLVLKANWETVKADYVFTVALTTENRILPNETGGTAGNNDALVEEVDDTLVITFAGNADQRALLGFTDEQWANMRDASEVNMKITATVDASAYFRTSLAQNDRNWGGSAVPNTQIYTNVADQLRNNEGVANLIFNINDSGKTSPFYILFVNANAGGAGVQPGVFTITEIEVTCKFN